MDVPLLDLKLQYAPLRTKIQERISAVCDSQVFCLGPKVAELESELANYSGAEFAYGTSSGTDAQLLLLMALGIGSGDAVLTTPYTFFATAGCVTRVGATPVFADIDLPTYNLDPVKVREFLEEHCERDGEGTLRIKTAPEAGIRSPLAGLAVKMIIPVHLFGCCAEMNAFRAIGQEFGLHIMEDAAQSIGAEYPFADGSVGRSGSMGESGYFSFYPTKNLGAFGDAGMAVCRDASLAAKVDAMRNHGMSPRYYHSIIGGNFRMDAIQAVVLQTKLPYLNDWSAARAENARTYEKLFSAANLLEHVTLPIEPYAGKDLLHSHIYNQYVIRCERRDELKAYLQTHKIGCEIYYPLSLHQQECFGYLGYTEGDFPNAERAARESLALPIFPELKVEQLEFVVRKIADFFA